MELLQALLVVIAIALVGYGLEAIHPGLVFIGAGGLVFQAARAIRKE